MVGSGERCCVGLLAVEERRNTGAKRDHRPAPTNPLIVRAVFSGTFFHAGKDFPPPAERSTGRLFRPGPRDPRASLAAARAHRRRLGPVGERDTGSPARSPNAGAYRTSAPVGLEFLVERRAVDPEGARGPSLVPARHVERPPDGWPPCSRARGPARRGRRYDRARRRHRAPSRRPRRRGSPRRRRGSPDVVRIAARSTALRSSRLPNQSPWASSHGEARRRRSRRRGDRAPRRTARGSGARGGTRPRAGARRGGTTIENTLRRARGPPGTCRPRPSP